MSNPVPINKIIEISTVDGPGARTSIFVQGCNIACAYCHNPETQRICINCGICVPGCPTGALSFIDDKVRWDKTLCIDCDNCIKVCPYNASPKVEWLTAQQVIGRVDKNIPFVRGITVSGGECSMYPDFLTELFCLAKARSLSCLMDSNGMVDLSLYPELMKLCDGVMLDVKAWDAGVYAKLTKATTNDTVKKNLLYLAQHHKLEEIRIVCVDNFVDTFAIIDGLAATIGDIISSVKLKLIKFRKFGVKGSLADHASPTDETMQTFYDYAKKVGFSNIVVL